MIAPLDDPRYEPLHSPVDGRIPEVVAKWGPRSQLRWFTRFRAELAPGQAWSSYYVHSEWHRGVCCFSCNAEYEHGTGVMMDGWCCCRDGRIGRAG